MKKILFPLMYACSVFATYDQPLIYDKYYSPYMGADDLLMTHGLVEKAHLEKLAQPLFSKTPQMEKIGRFSELFFLWLPTNYITTVVQHEVFGHGYRARSLGGELAHVEKYGFGVPIPYGDGGGYTRIALNPQRVTIFDMLSINSGGIESTSIFANKLRLNWLQNDRISPQTSMLYLLTQQDIALYISKTHKGDSGDISQYMDFLEVAYPKNKLSIDAMKRQAFVNLLDPFTYYSVYAWFKYVVSGEIGSIPMISIGSYEYLPSARLGLTPFGIEYYLENFLVKDNRPLYFYIRGGSFANRKYSGLGIEYPKLWESKARSLGIRADVWLQPEIDFKDQQYALQNVYLHYLQAKMLSNEVFNKTPSKMRMGASLSLIYQTKLWKESSLFIQIGGKSAGFLPGEELNPAVISRIGVKVW